MGFRPDAVRALLRQAAVSVFSPSPLYRRLAQAAAEDERLVRLACRASEFPPYLLFTSVHYLLLGETSDALAAFYPSAGGAAVTEADAARAVAPFRDFALRHEEEIGALLERRAINKTDLRRGACLRALLVEASRRLGARAVHLVDIGCSAGLNLLLDRWHFEYAGAGAAGPDDAPVRLRIESRGAPPPLGALPAILTRAGIDSAGADLQDPGEERWLLAHLLPEETELMEQTRRALAQLRRVPPEVHRGDAAALLPRLVGRLPGDAPVVVMHSLVIGFFTREELVALKRALEEVARLRPSARIGMEKTGTAATLGLALPAAAGLAACGTADLDGRWMAWPSRGVK